MKQLLTIALVLMVAIGNAQQSPNSNTGVNTATVNIILRDVQSVVVQQGQDVIDLIYDSPEKYRDGVSVTKTNHLEVFSTEDYTLESAVWEENLITQNDIYINNVLQSRQFQPILQGTKGSRLVDIEYKAKGNNEYLDKPKKTYTTQVIYTLTSR